jgi:hypothetical protein
MLAKPFIVFLAANLPWIQSYIRSRTTIALHIVYPRELVTYGDLGVQEFKFPEDQSEVSSKVMKSSR